MRELKLKYLLDLVSNIGPNAKKDSKEWAEAQKKMRDELEQTGTKLGWMERAMLRAGGVANASAARQADYLMHLARQYQNLRVEAERTERVLGRVMALGAGAAAGAYAADRMAQQPMEYSKRLAMMANTAFAERDAAGRIEGKRTLDAAIQAALKVGGGQRDDAAGALDALIASGALPTKAGESQVSVAAKMLPTIMRASTASGTKAEDIATIGLRAMQTFGLTLEQFPHAIDMAMAAGQAGGFELRDMAKWLPKAMAAGQASGLSGMEGFQRILASMQASVITAGSKDEAGNNVVGLLGKLNSADTAGKLKEMGVDLPAVLANAREKGVSSIDAFVQLMDKLAAKDPQYVAMQKKLAATTDEGERRRMLQDMVSIMQGKAVGQVMADRESLMALVAEMNNREYVKKVISETSSDKAAGTIDTAHAVMSAETAVKREAALNAVSDAAYKAFEKWAPAFNTAYDYAVQLNKEYPVLTAAMVTLAGAAGVAAAALGAGSLAGVLAGRGAGAAGAAGGAGMARTLAGLAFTRVALPVAAVAGAYSIYEVLDTTRQLMAAKRREAELDEIERNRQAQRGLAAISGRPGVPGAPDLLTLTAPPGEFTRPTGGPWREAMPGAGLGQGRLDIDVRVSDERVTATPTVSKPLPVIRIDAGHTNPGSYSGSKFP